MEYTHHYLSPLGGITLASDGSALTGLWFDGQKYFGSTLSTNVSKQQETNKRRHASQGSLLSKNLPVFEQADIWLNIYFSGKEPDFTPPLCVNTTPFRKAVWDILLSIPFGQTVTYGEIADRINHLPPSAGSVPPEKQGQAPRTSPRAVGNAVGRNPISLIIPCHRVLGANGSLTGYAGGLERKQSLLTMEKTGRPL